MKPCKSKFVNDSRGKVSIEQRLSIKCINSINIIYYTIKKGAIISTKKTKGLLMKRLPKRGYRYIYKVWLSFKQQASDKETSKNWYLKSGEKIGDIYKKLYKNSINYVVIDFSEYIKSKDDKITILCEDKSLDFIRSMFIPYDNGNKEILIYSISGHSFSGYNDSAFISPHIAEGVLERKVESKSLKFTPRKDDLLKIVIYDLCFHEGSKSRIMYEYKERDINDKKYNWSLIRKINKNSRLIFDQIGKTEINSYTDMVKVMSNMNWLPTREELIYLGRFDDWIKKIVKSKPANKTLDRFTVIFVLRDWVKENKCVDNIIDYLESNLIKVLSIYELNNDEVSNFLRMSRGGNWTRGCKEEINGGKPYAILICKLQSESSKVSSDEEIQDYIFRVKRKLRRTLNKKYLFNRHANMIHSSDDPEIAFEYLKLLSDDNSKHFIDMLK